MIRSLVLLGSSLFCTAVSLERYCRSEWVNTKTKDDKENSVIKLESIIIFLTQWREILLLCDLEKKIRHNYNKIFNRLIVILKSRKSWNVMCLICSVALLGSSLFRTVVSFGIYRRSKRVYTKITSCKRNIVISFERNDKEYNYYVI